MSRKIKSKFVRYFVCLTLALAMFVTTIPAQAAGTENWGNSEGPEENIRVTNTNLTPVKTITRSGTLTIKYITIPCKPGFCNCNDSEPSNYPPVRATVQIRTTTGRILATSSTNQLDYNAQVSVHVNSGDKIQVFFDVSTMPGYSAPGPYRKAHFSYYYTLR